MEKTVVFLGAKKIGYDCLHHLISHSGDLGIRLAGVLSKKNIRFPEIDLCELAETHGIPVFSSLEDMMERAPEIDLLISVQYHEILKPHHIQRARQLAINLHMAPLPEYRGCNQFTFAILDRKTEFGTTIHRLDPGIDSGAILAEERFPIPASCDVSGLHDLTEEASLRLFKTHIADIISGRVNPIEQSVLIPSRGTSLHFRKEIDQAKQIDPLAGPEKIALRIRATAMPGFEPPYAIINGQKQYYFLTPDGEIRTSDRPDSGF
jgi:methionyl-tRNA formyltransferase